MSDGSQDLRLLEALLFAASQPLDEETLADRLPPGADIPALLARLEEDYAARGVNLVRVSGKWALRTAIDLGEQLRRHVDVARKLSRAAIETLAIVAYHQPVTRAEIEALRGVSISRGTLDILLEAGWVRPKGRRRTPGRPATWVTTEGFLEHFGLDGLDDLPGIDELRAAGLLDTGRVSLTPMPSEPIPAPIETSVETPVVTSVVDAEPVPDDEAEPMPAFDDEIDDDPSDEDELKGRHGGDDHSQPYRAVILKGDEG